MQNFCGCKIYHSGRGSDMNILNLRITNYADLNWIKMAEARVRVRLVVSVVFNSPVLLSEIKCVIYFVLCICLMLSGISVLSSSTEIIH
jgi:predicted small integral membrane protein